MGRFDRLLDELQVGFEVGFGHVAGLGCFVVVHVLRGGLSGCVFFFFNKPVTRPVTVTQTPSKQPLVTVTLTVTTFFFTKKSLKNMYIYVISSSFSSHFLHICVISCS